MCKISKKLIIQNLKISSIKKIQTLNIGYHFQKFVLTPFMAVNKANIINMTFYFKLIMNASQLSDDKLHIKLNWPNTVKPV